MSTQDGGAPPRQSVRFSSHAEAIEPVHSLETEDTLTDKDGRKRQDLNPEAIEEIKNLSLNMQRSRLQSKRMADFSFEPVSLPASRAPSPSSGSRTPVSLRQHPSPSHPSSVHSPPLTPSATSTREGRPGPGSSSLKDAVDPAMVTPEISPPHEPPPTSISEATNHSRPASGRSSRRASPKPDSRPRGAGDVPDVVQPHPKQAPNFSVGPTGDSLPPSRDHSPGRSTPGDSVAGSSTPNGRPHSPLPSDKEAAYARSKRVPPTRGLDAIDARFKFAKDHARRGTGSANAAAAMISPKAPVSEARKPEGKRSSGFFYHRHHETEDKKEKDKDKDKEHDTKEHHHHSSMSELKRFFKLGHRSKEKKSSSKPSSRAPSPDRSGSIKTDKVEKAEKAEATGIQTPPKTPTQQAAVPFADDHGLQSKYGKFGKVLGSGAGGSVRLMKRSSDGVTFAVKQFRAKHSYESTKDYTKKVTGEFCIGSTLHHGNIIETMDLVNEKGNWYVVMEYAPYDLFAIVMTGKMSREEVACSTLQIVNGVKYIHSMGLAHRDLKLDNVVVNEHGIMKIIDFGSAAVFRYPFEKDIVLASGIVGSDPYLAPEVYDLAKYDPQPTDIWSLGIIFCCMTLRRFPWKQPRVSDNSYKLFVSTPEGGPSDGALSSNASTSSYRSEPGLREGSEGNQQQQRHQHSHSKDRGEVKSEPATNQGGSSGGGSGTTGTTANGASSSQQQQQHATIKGPWRLLRLLPRETRYIIGRMLDLDPRTRATMSEVLGDKWVMNSTVCRQEEGGQVERASGHEHTLQPPDSAGTEPKKV